MKPKTLYLSIFAMAASSTLFATDYYYSLDGTYYGITEPTNVSEYETVSIASPSSVTYNPTTAQGDLMLYKVGATSNAGGGALLLQNKATSVGGYFFGNTSTLATNGGGAMFIKYGFTVGSITATFLGNNASAGSGGAIYNNGATLTSVSGIFIDNEANTNGGAIYNYCYSNTNIGTISSITSTLFAGNTAGTSGGAIYNYAGSSIGTINSTFTNNTAGTSGGAIYNDSTIDSISGTFTGNTAGTSGGAIYNNGTITITTSGADTIFTGNTTGNSSDGYASNAIYQTATGKTTFSATGDYKIIVNDAISGEINTTTNKISTLTIATGTTVFNNSVSNSAIEVDYGATLALGSYAGSDLASASSANIQSTATLTVNGTLSLVVISTTESNENTVNDIKISSTLTFGDNASVVLDLSDIFGSFELNVTLTSDTASDFYTFLTTDLDVIFADTSVESTINTTTTTDGLYYYVTDSETGNYLADFTISADSTNYIITIAGTAVPEPSTYAMILGALALGFAYYRKRK